MACVLQRKGLFRLRLCLSKECDQYSMVIIVSDSADIRHLIGRDLEHIRRSSALLLFKLKEKRITQVAIDDIVESCQGLFSQTIDRVKACVKDKLAELGIDVGQMDGLDEACN